nr:TraU family protein [Desulfobacteraceae bacterium]
MKRNNRRLLLQTILIALALAGRPGEASAAAKSGSFMNPVGDVAWQEIFPIKIAGLTIMGGGGYDIEDGVGFPVCACPAPPPLFFRIGLPVSFWEPARLIETVETPFYFPFLGTGISPSGAQKGFLTGKNHNLAAPGQNEQSTSAQGHFMIFPVWSMLELLTDFACVEHSGFDLAYLTEIDPLWQDDELAFIIQPEALLFANPYAQM